MTAEELTADVQQAADDAVAGAEAALGRELTDEERGRVVGEVLAGLDDDGGATDMGYADEPADNFDESKHPRAADGKFGSGAGGGASAAPAPPAKRHGTAAEGWTRKHWFSKGRTVPPKGSKEEAQRNEYLKAKAEEAAKAPGEKLSDRAKKAVEGAVNLVHDGFAAVWDKPVVAAALGATALLAAPPVASVAGALLVGGTASLYLRAAAKKLSHNAAKGDPDPEEVIDGVLDAIRKLHKAAGLEAPKVSREQVEAAVNEQFRLMAGGGKATMNRDEDIGWLTANCDCWKGAGDELGLLDDERLEAVRAAHEGRATANAAITNNTAKAGVTMNLNEWLAAAPPEGREVWDRAVEVDRREREAVVARLTANAAGAPKDALRAQLMQKTLPELEALLAILPAAAEPAQNAARPAPNYRGAAAPVANREAEKDDSDNVLPVFAVNWDKAS